MPASSNNKFISFGAFANTQSAASAFTNTTTRQSQEEEEKKNTHPKKASPVYNGNNHTIAQCFKGFIKKDSITRNKALLELQTAAFGSKNVDSRTSFEHFVYVQCFPKLTYDNERTVRYHAVQVLHQARRVIPKAWDNFILNNEKASTSTSTATMNVLGCLFCLQADPAPNVANLAVELLSEIQDLHLYAAGIRNHLNYVLATFSRAAVLNEAFRFPNLKSNIEEGESFFFSLHGIYYELRPNFIYQSSLCLIYQCIILYIFC